MKTKIDITEKKLTSFIDKFDPKHRRLIRSVRKELRKRFPTANELVYDNYNFFVIAYGPTERPSDCIVSIAAAANGVGLCFIHCAIPRKFFSAPASRRVSFVLNLRQCSPGPKLKR